jgi:hypothetical protein
MANTMEQVRAIPRAAVDVTLKVVRLPLTTVESLLGRSGDREWPPAVAFDSFDAGVRQVFGALLRDDQLVREGRLEQAKVGQLRTASELDARAEAERAEARSALDERREQARHDREQAEARAEQRKEQLERERQQREREIEDRERAQRERARRAEQAREKALGRQQRAAKRAQVEAATEAVEAERDALQAKDQVVSLDQQIEQSKESRSNRA